MSKTSGLVFVALGAILMVIVTFYLTPNKSFSAAEKLSEIRHKESTVSGSIEQSLKEIIDEGGITGALQVINLAFSQKDIFLNDCHALSHFTGHNAPAYYHDDFDSLLEQASNFCARGFQHGAEAQIVLDGSDYGVRLIKLCDAIKLKDMNFSCFHGAGHAFLAETRDVNRSLKLCSSISDDISYEGDIEGCFEGVFSEVANLVGGYDGETGRKLTGVPPMEINVSPVKYCAQFDERYQAMCAFEINGIGFGINTSTEDVGLIMKSCITDAANAIISEACLFNVAASYVRHEIKRDGIVTFQPWILNESKHNRVVYLVAAGQEIAQHNLAGQTIDTDKFCDSFVEKDEIDLCKRQVISYELVAPVIEK